MGENITLLELARIYPEGLIVRETALGKQVFDALVQAWPNLAGTSAHSTHAEKLHRAEKLAWTPPLITFCLERHGGTVNGSTRADLHYWEVDPEKGEARIARETHRQLEKAAKALDCAALARDIVAVIASGNEHEGLVWADKKKTVRITVGTLIPETIKATTTGRRKRFRDALTPLMTEQGWEVLHKGNVISFSRANSGT